MRLNLTDNAASEMKCLNPSLRAQRNNPCLCTGPKWIASSHALLAMTGKQLYVGYISSRALRMRPDILERQA